MFGVGVTYIRNGAVGVDMGRDPCLYPLLGIGTEETLNPSLCVLGHVFIVILFGHGGNE